MLPYQLKIVSLIAIRLTQLGNVQHSIVTRAGQVRKLVRKSANLQLRTNKKSCGHADLRTLAA